MVSVVVVIALVASAFYLMQSPVSADSTAKDKGVVLMDQAYSSTGGIPSNIFMGNNQKYNTTTTLSYDSSSGAINYRTEGDQSGAVFVGIQPFINGNLTIRLKVSSDNWNSNVYILGSTFWIQTQSLSNGGARVISLYQTSEAKYKEASYDVPPSALEGGINTIHIMVSGTNRSLYVYFDSEHGVTTPLSHWSVQKLPYEPMTLPTLRFENEKSGYATYVTTSLYGVKETIAGGVVTAVPGNDYVPFGIDYPRVEANQNGTNLMKAKGQTGVAWADLQWLEYEPEQKAYIQSLLDAGWELGIHYNTSLSNHPLAEAQKVMKEQYDAVTSIFGRTPTSWCSYQNGDNVTHAIYAYNQLHMIWRNGYSGISYISNIGNLEERWWSSFWSSTSNGQIVYPSFTHMTDQVEAEDYSIDIGNFAKWIQSYSGKHIVGFNEYYQRVMNQVDTRVQYLNDTNSTSLKFSVQTNGFQARLMIAFPDAQNATVLKDGHALVKDVDYTVNGQYIVLYAGSGATYEVIPPVTGNLKVSQSNLLQILPSPLDGIAAAVREQ
ncbi:MAG: hypothetical protein SA339_04385 [Methanomassiliicoccus sp.]|nr:hypothetical protein [Methanomassiliicoccus sp.]